MRNKYLEENSNLRELIVENKLTFLIKKILKMYSQLTGAMHTAIYRAQFSLQGLSNLELT